MWLDFLAAKSKMGQRFSRVGLPVKLIAAALTAAAALAVSFIPGEQSRGVVVKVYDGDTLQLANGDKVRLIGIDAPEAHESEKLFADAGRTGRDPEAIKAMGRRAMEFTREWAVGQKVLLEYDVEKKDRYGRKLAYVFVPFPRPALSGGSRSGYIISREGKRWYFLNATILQAGYAQPMVIKPNVKYAQIFEVLYQQAQEYQLGLWQENKPLERKKARPKKGKVN